jgi:molecular chaperone GrpE
MVHYFDDNDAEYTEEPEDAGFDAEVDETEGNALQKIKELKDKLKACEKERKDYLDGWQRSKADYLNSKKRYDEERLLIASRAEDACIERLLPLCDSFDMAIAQKGEDAWDQGFKSIYSQLQSLLASMDVEAIEAEGKPFDPKLHEALKTEVVEDEEQIDQVIAVLQKGYTRRDRLIRPAKVVIGTGKN